ncbi:YceI family protein [Nonomuraea sp. NPDC049421]|uniref:YceI family protein n=1 Tax=Nonomuraea sp. NPDC049421 TaxID=3155275 RepID=UPI0034232865
MTTITSLSDLTGDYLLDAGHTRIGFVARHAMITKVRGQFDEFEGTAHLDGDDPAKSSVALTVQAKSIQTGHRQRDDHLRSNDFLAMEHHPTITFTSTGVEQAGESTFKVAGNLTIRGVTKPVIVDFELTGAENDPWGHFRVGFEGAVTINRKDWGINWNTVLESGGLLVSEKVTLELDIAIVRHS